MSFSSQLKKAMEEINMSQAELAEKTGLAKSSISQYVSGKNTPKEVTIEKIARVLGVTTELLNATSEEADSGKIKDSGKVSVAEAAKRMHKNRQFVRDAVREKRLPGTAVRKYSENGVGKWSFHIPRRKFDDYMGELEAAMAQRTGT